LTIHQALTPTDRTKADAPTSNARLYASCDRDQPFTLSLLYFSRVSLRIVAKLHLLLDISMTLPSSVTV
jgi:hypothetical protein